MNDVASRAGVSRKTVSRFIDGSAPVADETRARILTAMAQLGFGSPRPTGPPGIPASKDIVLLHDGSAPELTMLVEATLADQGDVRLLALRMCDDDPAGRLRRFLVRNLPSGVIVLPPLSDREELPAICAEAGIGCARLGYADLACDDRAAMAQLVHWLLAEGHGRVGFISHADSSLSGRLREEGYVEAMGHGLRNGPLMIVPGDGSLASGFTAAQILLDVSPRPAAIVAGNDEMAAGALQAAAQAGLSVPRDVSVIGFEDLPIAAKTCPPLTTMRVPWQDIAKEALARLLDGRVSRHTFAMDIVVRGSARPLARPPAQHGPAARLTLGVPRREGLRE
jgi:LacI family transcriptional regulator